MQLCIKISEGQKSGSGPLGDYGSGSVMMQAEAAGICQFGAG